ncbi:MAG TPA: 4Fe-4S dicluster domain-containing protein [Syntrophales bacterium]|nr:4Fe-4S dicluster domain-containing protein [Syntrophales bacterium]
MEKLIDKRDLEKFFNDLKEEYEIIGPTLKGGGTAQYSYTTFAPINKFEELMLDYTTTMVSPKNIFFPNNQVLYKFEKDSDGNITVEDVGDEWREKRVFFGMHPCDISALLRIDKVLLEEDFDDKRYRNKRENCIIIGITCNEPHQTCFCSTSGAGPDIEIGYDLLFTDIGEYYFVRAGTDIGEKLLSSDYFKKASRKDKEKRDNQIEMVNNALPEKLDIEKIAQNISDCDLDTLLSEFTNQCFTCGACNMVCPTCHCFSVVERVNPERTKGSRNLTWDSCHYEKFATMAGNVNVRPDVKDRFRHRVLDKFYYDATRYGTAFCVGCGRCRDFCPGHMSIRDAAKKIQEG